MKITGSLLVCVTAAAFTAATLLINPGPAPGPAASAIAGAPPTITISQFTFNAVTAAPGATTDVAEVSRTESAKPTYLRSSLTTRHLQTKENPMKKHYTAAVAMLAGLTALTACAGSEAATTATPATPTAVQLPVATTVPVAAAASATVVVKAGSSAFGQILVDSTGNTLYAFTNDTAAQSTCTGTCAEAWPPVIVDPSWAVAPGLDAGVFSTVVRADGTEQLMAGRFPLYRFSGDARPGDVNGQGSGRVWFVVDQSANIVEGDAVAPAESTVASTEAPAPLLGVQDNPLGQLLADATGRTLYGFTKDADGTPTCVDGCATAWPPVVVDGSLDLTTLPDSASFTIVDRPDGTKQLKAGKWPLYYFSGDAAPGDANGQGSGGIWFVVAPDATLIK